MMCAVKIQLLRSLIYGQIITLSKRIEQWRKFLLMVFKCPPYRLDVLESETGGREHDLSGTATIVPPQFL
jgi:hypothetical protein